jgi:hypothetical protein
VPDAVLARMRTVGADVAAAEGIAIARETLSAIRGLVNGVHVTAPGGRIDAALAVVETG